MTDETASTGADGTERTVVLYAPIEPGVPGGVQQFLAGVVGSLSEISTPDLDFVYVAHPDNPEWISRYTDDDIEIVARESLAPEQPWFQSLLDSVKQLARPILKRQRLTNRLRSDPEVSDANGYFESIGADLVHFPIPDYERTPIPTIFNPHDLRHLHYPETFSEPAVKHRTVLYRAGCEESAAVDVPSQFVRDDVVTQYDVSAEDVYAIERGPPTVLYEEFDEGSLDRAKSRYDVPDAFAFYPAQTWPHKNHQRLLEAVAALRDDKGVVLPLICTGKRGPNANKALQTTMDQLGLHDQVSFLGFVDPDVLRALYRLSQFVVIPSLFEGGGFPVLEAWAEGTPVACSNVTSLPEKAGDAALLFDPESVTEIRDALYRLHTDADTRSHLIEKGNARRELFDWTTTGKTYRALYRSVLDLPLTDQDQRLLAQESPT